MHTVERIILKKQRGIRDGIENPLVRYRTENPPAKAKIGQQCRPDIRSPLCNRSKKFKEKLKGDNQRAKSSWHFFRFFGTFRHIFTLFQSFSESFLQDFFLELKGFYYCFIVRRDDKRPKENKKKKTKPFCTLVVARLSSSEKIP